MGDFTEEAVTRINTRATEIINEFSVDESNEKKVIRYMNVTTFSETERVAIMTAVSERGGYNPSDLSIGEKPNTTGVFIVIDYSAHN